MNLTLLLKEQSILMDLKGTDNISVITELATALARLNKVKHVDELIQALLDREKLSSTAIGHGIALPHARTDAVDKLVCCVGLSKQGIDFKSSEPVRLIFVIVSPVSATEEHVQLLAVISKLCADAKFRKAMISAVTPSEALQAIHKKELPKDVTVI